MLVRYTRLIAVLFLLTFTYYWTRFRTSESKTVNDSQWSAEKPPSVVHDAEPPSGLEAEHQHSVVLVTSVPPISDTLAPNGTPIPTVSLDAVEVHNGVISSISEVETVLPQSPSQKSTDTHLHTPLNPDSPYAYVFYAAADQYACSVLVNIDRLKNLFHTKHRIIVLATPAVSDEFLDALNATGADVQLRESPPLAEGSVMYYADCLLKLVSFSLHKDDPTLQRVLTLDSDQLIVKNLDHVFDLPAVDLAAPRAYWLAKDFISSTFLLASLSDRLWDKVKHGIDTIGRDVYDMDLVNKLLGETVLMLPGSYATANGHWEDWNIPNWFMPEGHNGTYHANGTLIDLPHVNSKRDDLPAELSTLLSSPTPSTTTLTTQISPALIPEISFTHTPFPHPLPTPIPVLSPEEEAEAARRRPKPELTGPLEALYEDVHVLHYFALGKPWHFSIEGVRLARPDAHPVFWRQWEEWWEGAERVCPAGWSLAGIY
ncbi:glycosyltransferase family 8 protein [Patellaria atrata CBS 101060]|uniref:Glycosyltransferase family 8 protein n=1 Tax=Patellaria atrata CBS 101060 TaxID=1346257 RepID=A0A9P4VTJ7_9PEZI|nr:glycosyltransferase family 8 protein [Patellaria atrata CBS 101060]